VKTDFTFHYPTDATNLICQAHREGDEIELDHVWLGNTDILPVLEWGHATFLLCEIEAAALEYRTERHRESLMG
jgi:hypothetical protein